MIKRIFICILLIFLFIIFTLSVFLWIENPTVKIQGNKLILQYHFQNLTIKEYTDEKLHFFSVNQIQPEVAVLYSSPNEKIFIVKNPEFYGNGAEDKNFFLAGIKWTASTKKFSIQENLLDFRNVDFNLSHIKVILFSGRILNFYPEKDCSRLMYSLANNTVKDFYFEVPVSVSFSKEKKNTCAVISYLKREDGNVLVARSILELKYDTILQKIIIYNGIIKSDMQLEDYAPYAQKYFMDI